DCYAGRSPRAGGNQHAVAQRSRFASGLRTQWLCRTVGGPRNPGCLHSRECATNGTSARGYFAKQRNRRGRQLGRVLATRYGEVVVDRLFDGKTQLTRALQPLILAAEATLQLDEDKRRRTIVRVDAGGGSLGDVNWLLAR